LRALDKCGRCPHFRGFSPKRRIRRFGFFPPHPALASNASRWAAEMKSIEIATKEQQA